MRANCVAEMQKAVFYGEFILSLCVAVLQLAVHLAALKKKENTGFSAAQDGGEGAVPR